jgi:hypothetical protein
VNGEANIRDPMVQTIDSCIEQPMLGRGMEKNKSARDNDIMAPECEKLGQSQKSDAKSKK